MSRVPSYGPLNAPIAWIGESPGQEEVNKGQPFVGMTGQYVRGALRSLSIDPERDVWWSNVCEQRVWPWPSGSINDRLIDEWHDVLDGQLRQLTGCKVIVACGGVALQRLTGMTDLSSWWGSVIRRDDLPATVQYGKGKPRQLYWPPDAVCIPLWHPAGIFNDPSRRATPEFQRSVMKVAKVARGGAKVLKSYPFDLHTYSTLDDLQAARIGATAFAIDTEYHRETGEVYWVGITFNGRDVYGMPWEYPYIDYIFDICRNEEYVKIGQNIATDIRHLAPSNIEFKGELYDTMLAHYVLHPRLEVGLDHCARFYLEDVKWWKGMDHRDPYYNALDVQYTWHIRLEQLKEAARRPSSPLDEMNARFNLIPIVMKMEDVGMRVDVPTWRATCGEVDEQIAAIDKQVEEVVAPHWTDRVGTAGDNVKIAEAEVAALKSQVRGVCPKHPSGVSLLKADRIKIKCDVCFEAWYRYEAIRDAYRAALAAKGKRTMTLRKWDEGFNWQSSEHLGWFLFECLGLPAGRKTKTGKWATDASTMDAIFNKVEEAITQGKTRSKYYVDASVLRVIRAMKRAQELRKARSTFLDITLDDEGQLKWPHVSYKIHGTMTGRLTGGVDREDDDKMEAGGQSLMNMPDEWRRIYIPPPHHVFVSCDYSNQEGRLAAIISRDANYLRMFEEEDATGVKVHAKTAALIYDIDPQDAKRVKVTYQGGETTAYDGGKRARHAMTYSYMPVGMLINNYGMTLKEAERVYGVFHTLHPQLLEFKRQLVRDVLGEWRPDASRGKWRAACIAPGRRYQVTPFGWQVYWYGMGKVMNDPLTGKKVAVPIEANEVLAFGLGQAPGASVWPRVAKQLSDRGWHVATGQYDSVMVICPATVDDVRRAVSDMREVMGQPWPQLGGRGLPVEVKVGRNWGDWDADANPEGLKEYDDGWI